MQRLFVLMVGGVLLGMYLSSSITLAEQTTQAFKELQDKYHKALQEIERLQSELDEARRAIEQLQPRAKITNSWASRRMDRPSAARSSSLWPVFRLTSP
jgi:peptidoglycan hydrolase CwlO-like protein